MCVCVSLVQMDIGMRYKREWVVDDYAVEMKRIIGYDVKARARLTSLSSKNKDKIQLNSRIKCNSLSAVIPLFLLGQ